MQIGKWAIWIKFHNDIERELKRFGTFEEIRDFASKAAENMARIAACIHVFVFGPTGRISKDLAINACKISLWYLNEARRILCLYHKTQVEEDAETLLNWFIEKGYQDNDIKAADLLRYGPNQLRDKKRRDVALKLLIEHRCILQTGSPINKAVLKLHPKAGEILK